MHNYDTAALLKSKNHSIFFIVHFKKTLPKLANVSQQRVFHEKLHFYFYPEQVEKIAELSTLEILSIINNGDRTDGDLFFT